MTEMDVEAIAEAVVRHMKDGTFARDLMSPEDVAKALGISPRKARELVKEGGEIPSFKVGTLRRVDPREFDAYVAKLKEPE